MKRILKGRSNRWGHDGWALCHRDARNPWSHTVCTTRQEARELKQEYESRDPDFFRKIDIIKVRIVVERVGE